ncbi:hypothetical protein [Paenibacillus sp. MBLB4367]|uniref:hypothetical protein n=1 Tax=Paenibacillus sp. MBLB4367 TaxID=3384767 RepID=UPI003907EAA1
MTNTVKREIETIPIPPELHRRSKLGIQAAKAELDAESRHGRRKTFYRRMAVALTAGVLLVPMAVYHSQVVASIQKALQYVPGIGIVKEEEISAERYVLKHPVTAQIGRGEIAVTGMMVDDEMTLISISGTKTAKLEHVIVRNGQGTEYTVNSSMSSWSPGEWSASFWFQGKMIAGGQVELIAGDNPQTTIPLTLVKAESFDSYGDMGETMSVNGVTITAVASRTGEKAMISLLSQQPKELRIADYGLYGVHSDQKLTVTDESGTGYDIERIHSLASPAREFYFPISVNGAKNYTLTIPEINTEYADQTTVQVPTVTVDHLNQTFEIAGFPVTIDRTERIGDNQLRLYVDLHYDEHAPRSLHSFRVDGMSHSAKMNERTGEIEYVQFDIDPGSKKIKLKIVRPEVLLRGPWTFRLPAERYFGS